MIKKTEKLKTERKKCQNINGDSLGRGIMGDGL